MGFIFHNQFIKSGDKWKKQQKQRSTLVGSAFQNYHEDKHLLTELSKRDRNLKVYFDDKKHTITQYVDNDFKIVRDYKDGIN